MARIIGINHVALEVDDVDEALAWYAQFLDFELRGRRPGIAWIDLGDQFIALIQASLRARDEVRHCGLVVDDKEEVRAALIAAGVRVASAGHLQFRDPSGNNIDIVDYRDVQFTKAPEMLRALGVDGIEKTAEARAELRVRGLAG